jgi:hypothetical protein
MTVILEQTALTPGDRCGVVSSRKHAISSLFKVKSHMHPPWQPQASALSQHAEL